MFGRSDTDGYQPLEELEAEESHLAESPSAAEDESRGPRFASWVPFVGDPLCVAAGWLRLNPWLAVLFIALGKFARYVAIAALAA